MITALQLLDNPGPVLSKQEELGFQGHQFQMFSFRTESHALHGCPVLESPSVTRIGAFLYWTRIDSLPQLINVLRGDLTIIGTGRHSALSIERGASARRKGCTSSGWAAGHRCLARTACRAPLVPP
jgi:putative colanic acid biosynthesis UDP-glucose lipid carrier transferase